jgi:hypothetical protein
MSRLPCRANPGRLRDHRRKRRPAVAALWRAPATLVRKLLNLAAGRLCEVGERVPTEFKPREHPGTFLGAFSPRESRSPARY